MVLMEIHCSNLSSRKDVLPFSRSVVESPASSSSRYCLSCIDLPLLRSHSSYGVISPAILIQCWTTLMGTSYPRLTQTWSGLNHRMPFSSLQSCFLHFLSEVLIPNILLAKTIFVSFPEEPTLQQCHPVLQRLSGYEHMPMQVCANTCDVLFLTKPQNRLSVQFFWLLRGGK